MANPRNTVSFVGVDPVFLTFKIDNSTITWSDSVTGGSSQVNLAVTFSADDTVALAADGAQPIRLARRFVALNAAAIASALKFMPAMQRHGNTAQC